MLARDFEFDGAVLARAIAATFARRETMMPRALPPALSREFGADPDKRLLWDAFRKRGQLRDSDADLASVVEQVRMFAMPCFEAIVAGRPSPGSWAAGGPWRAT